MPTPAVALSLKRFRRRFGISAPRTVVSSHLSWRWFALPMALKVLFAGLIGWMVVQRNEAEVLGLEMEARALQGDTLKHKCMAQLLVLTNCSAEKLNVSPWGESIV